MNRKIIANGFLHDIMIRHSKQKIKTVTQWHFRNNYLLSWLDSQVSKCSIFNCRQAGPRGFEMGSMQGWCFLRLIWKVEVITMFVCFIFSMLMFCRCFNLEILRCNVLIVNINNNINTEIKVHLQLWIVNFHSDITVLG